MPQLFDREVTDIARHALNVKGQFPYLKMKDQKYKYIEWKTYQNAVLDILNSIKVSKKDVFEDISKNFAYERVLSDYKIEQNATFDGFQAASSWFFCCRVCCCFKV